MHLHIIKLWRFQCSKQRHQTENLRKRLPKLRTPPCGGPTNPHIIEPNEYDLLLHNYIISPSTLPPPKTIGCQYFIAASVLQAHEKQSYFIVNSDDLSLECFHLSCVPDKDIWIKSLANYLGRPSQGVGNIIKGTKNISSYLDPASHLDVK